MTVKKPSRVPVDPVEHTPDATECLQEIRRIVESQQETLKRHVEDMSSILPKLLRTIDENTKVMSQLRDIEAGKATNV